MILYGLVHESETELLEDDATKLSTIARTYPDLRVVIADGKVYLGEVISNKNAFKAEEVVNMINDNKVWHDRFIVHIVMIAKDRGIKLSVQIPKHHALDSMKTKEVNSPNSN